jgi:hypothetical protein
MSKKEYKQNPDFPKVGAMVLKREKDNFGKDAYYIKIDENTKVTINGKEVKSLNIQRPMEKYHRMLESGKITEQEFNEKEELYSPDGDFHFIKFEVSADLRDEKDKKKR